MTSRLGTAILASISILALAIAGVIFYVVFPYADTTPDPDKIQSVAWVAGLFSIIVSIIFGGTALTFGVVSSRNES